MARVARDEDRAKVTQRRGADRTAGSEPAGDGEPAAPSRTRASGDTATAGRTRAGGDAAAARRTRQRGAEPAPTGDGSDSDTAAPATTQSGSADRISAPAAAKAGLRQIVELTGKEPEGVTSVQRAGDGWVVAVEVVEDRRIPSSSDILAVYDAELDADGELMSYRRNRRYSRGRGGSDEAS